MIGRIALRSMIVIAIALMDLGLRGQSIDVSICFNPTLQGHVEQHVTEDMLFATYSQVTSDNYDVVKRNLMSSGSYGMITGSLNYNDFSQQRTKYFEAHHVNMEDYKYMSLISTNLGDPAYKTIDHCVDDLTADREILAYAKFLQGSHQASLDLFWRKGGAHRSTSTETVGYIDRG